MKALYTVFIIYGEMTKLVNIFDVLNLGTEDKLEEVDKPKSSKVASCRYQENW
jgi:hypothetical protein